MRVAALEAMSAGDKVPPRETTARRVFAACLTGLLTILFLLLIAPFFEALVLAAIFSAMLFPIYARARRRLRPNVAALATTLLGALVIVLPLSMLVGVVAREAVRMSEVVGPWVDGYNDVAELAVVVPEWVPYRRQILNQAGEAINQTGTFLMDRLTIATQGTVIFVVNLFVMLYAMFSFLVYGPRLLARIGAYVPLDDHDKYVIAARGVAITRATLKSVLVIGALQGTLGGAAFAVAGLPSPVFWGIVMAVASALPVLGTALVWLPAVFVLLVRGEPTAALALGLWCTLVVSTLDNFVRPHLIGTDAKMPDLVVLLGMLGGIALFGTAGIFIGPVLAGMFLTSLEIFAATFERELKDGAETPVLVRVNGPRRAPDEATADQGPG